MNQPNHRVRRATIDDLPALVSLWESLNYPVMELEKRLTEFQVVETEDGQFLGALGLQIQSRQGLIHSEGFTDFALSDSLRVSLWDRLQKIAANHGLLRLWTREPAPFWDHNGFLIPNEETLNKLPAPWQGPVDGLLALQLKDDSEPIHISLDREFALFKETEQQRTRQIFEQAKMLKGLAIILASILVILVISAIVFILRRNPNVLGN